jgi:solute carrier family 50 protein (sugar transporter)
VLGLFAIIAVGSLQITDRMIRWLSVGSLTVVSLISMFASPLFIIVSKSITLALVFPSSKLFTVNCLISYCFLLMSPEFGDPNKEC